jgi:hypothetical protein
MTRSFARLHLRRSLLIGCVGLGMLNAGFGPLSCAQKRPTVRERSDTLASDHLRESIARQIGTAACSSPAVCRTLPLGAKPCGGPRQYLVYSLSVTDSARLAVDAARYNQAEALKNRDEGLVSDCSMLIAPRVSCVSRKCAAVESEGRRAY